MDANQETPEQQHERETSNASGGADPNPADDLLFKFVLNSGYEDQKQIAAKLPPAPKTVAKAKPAPTPAPDISKIITPEDLQQPTHPAHAAFHWGRFFAMLAAALAVAAPEVNVFNGNNLKIGAAITGAEQIFGTLSQGFAE